MFEMVVMLVYMELIACVKFQPAIGNDEAMTVEVYSFSLLKYKATKMLRKDGFFYMQEIKMATLWLEGLLDGDETVNDDVFSSTSDVYFDRQVRWSTIINLLVNFLSAVVNCTGCKNDESFIGSFRKTLDMSESCAIHAS